MKTFLKHVYLFFVTFFHHEEEVCCDVCDIMCYSDISHVHREVLDDIKKGGH